MRNLIEMRVIKNDNGPFPESVTKENCTVIRKITIEKIISILPHTNIHENETTNREMKERKK